MIYALFICIYAAAGSPMDCRFLDGPYASPQECHGRQKMYPTDTGNGQVGHTVFRCMGKPGWAAVD